MEYKECIGELNRKKEIAEQKIEAAIEEFHRDGLMQIDSVRIHHVYAYGKTLPQRVVVSLSVILPSGGQP